MLNNVNLIHIIICKNKRLERGERMTGEKLGRIFNKAIEKATDITSIFFVAMAVISAVKFILQNEEPLFNFIVCVISFIVVCLYRLKYIDTTM